MAELILCSVVSFLVQKSEPVRLSALLRHLQQIGVNVSRDDLKSILSTYPQHFEINRQSETFILFQPKIEICEDHCTKVGCDTRFPLCSDLHLCKFYILTGTCKFGQNCAFGHDLTTSHNMQVLKVNFLNQLPVTTVLSILRQNKNTIRGTKPIICHFYNKGDNSCRNSAAGKVCPFMHLCKQYVSGSCTLGQGCKRSHNLQDQSVLKVLQKHGINTQRSPRDVLSDLREMYADDIDSGSFNSAPAQR